MYIGINDSLFSDNLHIGNRENDENCIRMIVDTGATMNTGSLEYHIWVKSQCLEMAEEYLQCDKDTSYDVVYLLTALDLKDTDQDVDHRKMTAVIRYNAPYIV